MSLPNRNNPYTFDEFLEWRNSFDYYCDDSFLQQAIKYYAKNEWKHIDEEARKISPKVSFRWKDLSEKIAQPENRPFLMHYDGHHHRIDRIVRPHEIEVMEKEVFGEALFSSQTSPWVKLIKMFLIYQNGESCIACPLTCTEGLVEILEAHNNSPEIQNILTHCKEGIDGDFGIGAQYLSEIQGGSDVPANLLEAVYENDTWRLYGTKFFCSAAHADYAIVTAKPTNSEKIAVFVIPSWLDKSKEQRNHFTIDRLKWKMGTSELPTGEITFNGAIAYPVGPLERGLANVVGIVLTYSRLTVGLSAAASMTRVAREARKYAEFRKAFGLPIAQFPMVELQLQRIENHARRTTAGALKIYKLFLDHKKKMKAKKTSKVSLKNKKDQFNIRELIMLQKITASFDSMNVIREAMSIFGGHGVMEDFSSLPRLFRDAAVNELWEGPRNVLLFQIYKDIKRAASWYPPIEFVRSLIKGANSQNMKYFEQQTEQFMNEDLTQMTDHAIYRNHEWSLFCQNLITEYQLHALAEIEECD